MTDFDFDQPTVVERQVMLGGERSRRLDPGTLTLTLRCADAALLVAYAHAGLAAREALPCATSDVHEAVDRRQARGVLEAIAALVAFDLAARRPWSWEPPEPKRRQGPQRETLL